MDDLLHDIRRRLAAWNEPPCQPAAGTPQSRFPGGAGGCGWCDHRIRNGLDNWMDRISRPFIVCVECGNKRCPKAWWHGNACTGSNEPGQDGEWPEGFTAEDVRFLLRLMQPPDRCDREAGYHSIPHRGCILR